MTMERARQIIATWVGRAIVLGYLQEIPPVAAMPLAQKPAPQLAHFPDVPGGMLPTPLLEPLVQRAAASNGP